MNNLLTWLGDWITDGLIEAITAQYADLFASVNGKVGDIAADVGQTPQGWNV
jgi:hypothetical protein